eukprot:TRINITY_DN25512_c1_g2_i2.p1 TRINITY_DN25512_c1_g2~~TRINITY_DN25512_c1_g2_i2.p1  ORF type:complete len:496 (-),score=26.91 TRINITY_DN25512_c1_g2_i2:280-1713(-)
MLQVTLCCTLNTHKFCPKQRNFGLRRAASKHNRATNLKVINSEGSAVEVLIIGAGIAGLACATRLINSGVRPLILEASDDVGGRVRTDEVDGFLLDRGFQIFLSSYPNAKQLLDYEQLDLRPFYAGALVYYNGSFHRVADPFRHFADSLGTLFNPIGSIKDKLFIGKLRLQSLQWGYDEILERKETTVINRLKEEGFSSNIIDRFFRPFLGGIFFNNELTTTSRMLEFVMKMLATGSNCLPAKGIGAITQQMAKNIPSECIRLGQRVESIGQGQSNDFLQCVAMDSDTNEKTTYTAKRGLVLATEGSEAQNLLSSFENKQLESHQGEPVGTCCLYFCADKPPTNEPILFLDGNGDGIINNCCFPTNVTKTYSSDSRALISASTVGIHSELSDDELEAKTREQMTIWFGKDQVDNWKHLRTYRIPYAQPCQQPPTNLKRGVKLGDKLFVCGDHRDTATFDGAIVSGQRTADAILRQMQ